MVNEVESKLVVLEEELILGQISRRKLKFSSCRLAFKYMVVGWKFRLIALS